jgi:hypothetical protein
LKDDSFSSTKFSYPSLNSFDSSILITKLVVIPHLKDHLLAFKGSTVLLLKVNSSEIKLIDECSLSHTSKDILITSHRWELFQMKETLLLSMENGKSFTIQIQKNKLISKEILDLKTSNPFNIMMKIFEDEENDEGTLIFCSSRSGDSKLISLSFNDSIHSTLVTEFVNISPIVDLVSTHNEYLVCSGGSSEINDEKRIKIVQNGLNLNSVLRSEPNYKG